MKKGKLRLDQFAINFKCFIFQNPDTNPLGERGWRIRFGVRSTKTLKGTDEQEGERSTDKNIKDGSERKLEKKKGGRGEMKKLNKGRNIKLNIAIDGEKKI